MQLDGLRQVHGQVDLGDVHKQTGTHVDQRNLKEHKQLEIIHSVSTRLWTPSADQNAKKNNVFGVRAFSNTAPTLWDSLPLSA